MSATADPAEDKLLRHPWLPVTIDGCQLLVKSCFGETAYRVLLTDTLCVWEESMDAAAIETRAQELNRRLRASARAFFSHLCDVARPCLSGCGQSGGEAQICVSRREDGAFTLRLKSELAGLPFCWEFHCRPAPIALVCAHLVRPLLEMSRLLQRQVEHLGALLVRKDEEIQDYQENGATLSRERLQTDVYDKQRDTEGFIQKTLPLLRSEPSDAQGFGVELQQLYAAVLAHRIAPKRKLSEEAGSEQPAQTATAECESVRDDPTRNNGNQNCSQRLELADAGNPSRPAAQTEGSAVASARPAERLTSKPKKKKVGLFS